MAEVQYQSMKKDLDDLQFENQSLKKDFQESTNLLRQTQDKLIQMEQLEAKRIEQEAAAAEKLMRQKLELEATQVQQRESKEMASTLKSAYMAEKKMLQDKINDLETKLTNRIKEVKSLEQKIHMLCQAENS